MGKEAHGRGHSGRNTIETCASKARLVRMCVEQSPKVQLIHPNVLTIVVLSVEWPVRKKMSRSQHFCVTLFSVVYCSVLLLKFKLRTDGATLNLTSWPQLGAAVSL